MGADPLAARRRTTRADDREPERTRDVGLHADVSSPAPEPGNPPASGEGRLSRRPEVHGHRRVRRPRGALHRPPARAREPGGVHPPCIARRGGGRADHRGDRGRSVLARRRHRDLYRLARPGARAVSVRRTGPLRRVRLPARGTGGPATAEVRRRPRATGQARRACRRPPAGGRPGGRAGPRRRPRPALAHPHAVRRPAGWNPRTEGAPLAGRRGDRRLPDRPSGCSRTLAGPGVGDRRRPRLHCCGRRLLAGPSRGPDGTGGRCSRPSLAATGREGTGPLQRGRTVRGVPGRASG